MPMVLYGGQRFTKFQSKSQLFTTCGYIVVKSCETLRIGLKIL